MAVVTLIDETIIDMQTDIQTLDEMIANGGNDPVYELALVKLKRLLNFTIETLAIGESIDG